MWLIGISGHGAGDLVSQWDSTIKSPLMQVGARRNITLDVAWIKSSLMHAVTSRCPS